MKSIKAVYTVLLTALLLAASACGNAANNAATNASKPAEANAAAGTQGKEESPKGLTTIKLGMVCGGLTTVLAQTAMFDGSFEKAGLKIERTCFNGGADSIKALVGGSLDINLGSYEHILRQQKAGLDVKAYGEIFDGIGYSLLAKKDAPINSLADVKGKTLGVTKVGGLADTGLRKGLKEAGVNPERDVTLVGAGSGATMLAAIDKDQVVGGMLPEPLISNMLASGKYKMVYDTTFHFSGIIVMSKAEWVSKNTETMKTFLRVLSETNDRLQKDPQSAIQPLKQEFPEIAEDVLLSAVKNQLARVPEGLKLTKEGTDAVVETQIAAGAIQESIPLEKTTDLTLLP